MLRLLGAVSMRKSNSLSPNESMGRVLRRLSCFTCFEADQVCFLLKSLIDNTNIYGVCLSSPLFVSKWDLSFWSWKTRLCALRTPQLFKNSTFLKRLSHLRLPFILLVKHSASFTSLKVIFSLSLSLSPPPLPDDEAPLKPSVEHEGRSEPTIALALNQARLA